MMLLRPRVVLCTVVGLIDAGVAGAAVTTLVDLSPPCPAEADVTLTAPLTV